MRKQLWLQQLDKNTRWVGGEKIDITNSLEEYFKTLKWHQERNKELGYGNDKKNWKREEYEKQRRIAMLQARTNTERLAGEAVNQKDLDINKRHVKDEDTKPPKGADRKRINDENKIWKQINHNLNEIKKREKKFG